jgi:hypothetical protein
VRENTRLQYATRLPLSLQCQAMGTLEDIYVAYVDSDDDEVISLLYMFPVCFVQILELLLNFWLFIL